MDKVIANDAAVNVASITDTHRFEWSKTGMYEPWHTCFRIGDYVRFEAFESLHTQAVILQTERDALQEQSRAVANAIEQHQLSDFSSPEQALQALKESVMQILGGAVTLSTDDLSYQENLVHRGANQHRLKVVPEYKAESRELAFATSWEEMNNEEYGGNTLAYLLAENPNETSVWAMKMKSPYNQAAATAAATAIQWLGTSVGFNFLCKALSQAGCKVVDA
jgi:hypothetical protein